MRMIIHDVRLPLRHVFQIAHGRTEQLHNLVVELREEDRRGFGEAAPLPYYGVTVETIRRSLESVRPIVEATDWSEPDQLWATLRPHLDADRFALCAIDEAAHDLWGWRHGQPVWRLWGLDAEACPPTNYTIGLASIEQMVAKMREFPDFGHYKIKLDANRPIDRIAALRQHTEAVFRVDANTAWSADQTIDWSAALAELGVEFIEQPLPADQWRAMERVRGAAALPIIADESCILPEDIARCAGLFDGVNIKLTKAGGLTPARQMVREARNRSLRVMVGCMTETTVGISAIAQIAPMLDDVDMDGALLLARDIADGVQVVAGQVLYPDRPGLGLIWRGDQP